MEILLGLLFGACWGLLAHYTLPHRRACGAALAPMLGAVVGGAVWLVLTWAGLDVGNGWLWVAAIAAPAIVCFLVVPILTASRTKRDARDEARLGLS